MTPEERKSRLAELVAKYLQFKELGRLNLSSEETIRMWLNDLLEIFGWDVRDTSQILQEKVLSPAERERLRGIGSQNIRPDYTFKIAKQKLTFLDAKDITVDIKNNPEVAFQIKSYGWSILAPCAFVSNFQEFAIYDCTYVPSHGQNSDLGRIYLTVEEYVDHFELLETHLLKENIYSGKLHELYSTTLQNDRGILKVTPDISFAAQLSEFRLILATNILQNNPQQIGNNSEKLSYIVQIIINRILFIRVCEARKIEEEGLLLYYKEHGFWGQFKNSSYFEFYQHYDGPLFERINDIHNIIVSDEVFSVLLEHLYYPSPYRFDVIPTKLLSDIYEIFLAKKLSLKEGVVEDEIKSEYLKTKGAVSTPQYIVDEIIKRTVTKEDIERDGIQGLLSVKILDIACGSGAFIIGAYDYLEESLLRLYRLTHNENFSKYFYESDTDVIVNLSGKKAIIDNCIYGVDIDPEAVEVAKMSLSLKIIDNTEYLESYNEIGIFGIKILNGVGCNIKCGNSIVQSDILNIFPHLRKNQEEIIKTNIFDWSSEQGFKCVFDQKGGFDFIIGNPPYVEVKNYNVDLPYMHLYIKEKYISAKNGKIDLAIPFIEKSLSLLNPTGKLGFIIQKRFFKTDYGKKIRELITSNNYLSSIIDFATTSIFKDRMTYVALLILDKASPRNFTYKLFNEKPEVLPSILRDISLQNSVYCLILPSNAISANPWSFEDSQLIEIRTRLLELGCLGDFANVKVGIQVLWDRAYHIRPTSPVSIEDGIIKGKSNIEDDIEIELDACRPLICNEKFYPYRDDKADVYAIFPYEVENYNATKIGFSDFSDRYNLAGEYLARNRHRIESEVETLPLKHPERYSEDCWHLYTREQNHGATYPKILVPMTAQDTFASVSFSDKIYCDNANIFFIEVPIKNEEYLYALSAIINSTIYSVLARSIANPQAGGYFKFNKQFLEPVPFPCEEFVNNNQLRAQLAGVAIEIKELQQRYIFASPNQKQGYRRLLTEKWQEIDRLSYQFYHLSQIDIAFFESKGRNIDRVDILD